jgi:hypothetical protein
LIVGHSPRHFPSSTALIFGHKNKGDYISNPK